MTGIFAELQQSNICWKEGLHESSNSFEEFLKFRKVVLQLN